MPQHDATNKLIFSNAEVVRDLLTGFIHHPWIRQAQLDTLERKFNSYVSDDLRERLDDMIWRVRWKDGRWLYVYLMLEFQSTVDPLMALRILTYVSMLLQDLVKGGEALPGELPPVLPIVLYNGSAPWTAPLQVSELMAPSPPGLEPYQPESRYVLLDEKRLDDHELASMRNLAAALFRLEKSHTVAEIAAVVDDLAGWISSPGDENLDHAFTSFLNEKTQAPPGMRFTHLKEAKSMLAETIQGWYDAKKSEGVKQGEATMLLRQLEVRFGPLEEDVKNKVDRADADTLLKWGERFVSARRIEDVVS